MYEETLIVEQILAKLKLEHLGRNGGPSSEFGRIGAALRSLCDAHQFRKFTIYSRVHTVLHSRPGETSETTVCSVKSDGGVYARLVLQVEESPAQRVTLEFTLSGASENYPACLQATFNPTTILGGNNVHPATLADPDTGEARLWPSSDLKSMARMNRLAFDLLEELNRQASGTKAPLFAPGTRMSIDRGDIHVIRAQWCAYLPTPDVPSFLQTVGLMFDHAIAEGKTIVQVATHLGFTFDYYPKGADRRDITGVMLTKCHGKKPLFSIVFYNKERRVADMRQGKTLAADEIATVRGNVRFDVTLHTQGILALVKQARKRIEALVKAKPSFGESWREQFLAGDPQSTVWFLERAVYVLSYRKRDGALKRGSFSEWLVPHMISKVLHLDVLSNFDRGDLHRLSLLDDDIAAAWRADAANDPGGWAKRLAAAAGCTQPTVHKRRDEFIGKYGIDIRAPYAVYRDILFFGSNSVVPPDQRAAFLSVGRTNRPVDVRRILDDAAEDFDRRRVNIVGRAIKGRPLTMKLKVALDKPVVSDARRAVARRTPSDRDESRHIGRAALFKPARRRTGPGP